MKCYKCGEDNEDDSRFCEFCGFNIEEFVNNMTKNNNYIESLNELENKENTKLETQNNTSDKDRIYKNIIEAVEANVFTVENTQLGIENFGLENIYIKDEKVNALTNSDNEYKEDDSLGNYKDINKNKTENNFKKDKVQEDGVIQKDEIQEEIVEEEESIEDKEIIEKSKKKSSFGIIKKIIIAVIIISIFLGIGGLIY